MNYFEVLNLPETVSDEQVIDAAYVAARQKWQTALNQAVGEQQRLAREMMNGRLDDAYETVRDAGKRQRYLRELKLAQESGTPLGSGRVKVSFSLSNGHADHEFLIVHNPVRHRLESAGLSIDSFQEYVCRAWEEPDMALAHVENRTLERWMYYAAGEKSIAEAIQFFRWEPKSTSALSLLITALDLLHTRYPTPILPLSPDTLLKSLPEMLTPTWRVSPAVANLGLLTGKEGDQNIRLSVMAWKEDLGQLSATVNARSVALQTSQNQKRGFVDATVNMDMLQRGELLDATITIQSERYGLRKVRLFAARPNRMMGNKELAQQVNLQAGRVAMEIGDYGNAVRFLRMGLAEGEAAKAEYKLVEEAYERHDWLSVIQLSRRYHDRYDHSQPGLQLMLVESLRMVAGTIFQLGEQRRALEHLAALACETAFVEDKAALIKSWTSQPETQLRLNLQQPKEDWVAITEHFDLNWTHASGRADGSNYAGEVPLDLSGRRVSWRTNTDTRMQPPLIAYEGVLVARTSDNRQVVGLDAASGNVLWRHTGGMNGTKCAIPVAGGESVYIADPLGGLYVVDVMTGKQRWRTQLGDGKDVSLAYADGILFVGEGQRFVAIDADDGSELGGLAELKAWGGMGSANPLNLLVSDGCCLFQMVGGRKPSLVFADTRNDGILEFEMPNANSAVGAVARSIFGKTAAAASTWASWEGEIYIPYLVTMQIECKQKYRDSNGIERTDVERRSWDEANFFVYQARSAEPPRHLAEVVQGTPYEENNICRLSVQGVKSANACAATPVYAQVDKDGGVQIYEPDANKPLHRLVAAAFGRDVYYWIVTDRLIQLGGYRRADGVVQALAYAGPYDMVTTPNSLSTSFGGDVDDGNSTTFFFPEGMGNVVGSPAIYGDIIYVTTNEGRVVAIGR